jgi:hypothetical protein
LGVDTRRAGIRAKLSVAQHCVAAGSGPDLQRSNDRGRALPHDRSADRAGTPGVEMNAVGAVGRRCRG